MHQKIESHIDHGHPPSIVNHCFDPRPQFPGNPYRPPIYDGPHHPLPRPNPNTWAYYGTLESYRAFIDTNQFSNGAPGVSSGLYNPAGPLNLGGAAFSPTFLTSVHTTSQFSLNVTFTYSNEAYNETVNLSVGKLYNVTYLEEGNLKRCSGKCVDIWKIYGSNDSTSYYKIKFDCSVNYNNQTVVIKNDQIRALSLYTGYESEPVEIIQNGVHKYGTTTGTISNAVITNATLDTNGNLIEGDIINGTIDGYTIDGIATGMNSNGTEITTVGCKTKGGNIVSGKIISGLCRGGNVSGTTEPDTNITVKATVRGVISNAIIMNATVEGGTSTEGKIIETTISEGVLYNATITGDDMVTVGGITSGNITTGGTTTGGTATGGTMVGVIDGKVYTIENGVTNQKSEDKPLITAGGVVVGGTIIGGVKQGNTIVGAIVKGGVVSSGVTVNGETSGGTLIPTPSATVPITKPILQDPEYRDLRPETVPTPENPYTGPGIGQHVHEPSIPPGWSTDDLTIIHNMDEGSIKTNFGTAKIQGIDNLIDTPIPVPRKEDHNW